MCFLSHAPNPSASQRVVKAWRVWTKQHLNLRRRELPPGSKEPPPVVTIDAKLGCPVRFSPTWRLDEVVEVRESVAGREERREHLLDTPNSSGKKMGEGRKGDDRTTKTQVTPSAGRNKPTTASTTSDKRMVGGRGGEGRERLSDEGARARGRAEAV